MTTEEKINRLLELENELAESADRWQKSIDSIIAQLRQQCPDLYLEWRDAETNKVGETGLIQDEIARTKEEIATEVLALGKTVHGNGYMAVYNKPRESWDSGLLKGYAVAHPDILACLRVAEQGTVSFRRKGASS